MNYELPDVFLSGQHGKPYSKTLRPLAGRRRRSLELYGLSESEMGLIVDRRSS